MLFVPLLRRMAQSLAVIAAVAALPASAGDSDLERIGTFLSIALPGAAGVCAARQGRSGEFWAGLATEMVIVDSAKAALGNAAINMRPNGGNKGFPSGHMASASYGATSLARKCFADKPALKALSYGLALLVGYSRVKAGKHEWDQVAAGAVVGYFANGITVSAGPGSFGLGYSMEF